MKINRIRVSAASIGLALLIGTAVAGVVLADDPSNEPTGVQADGVGGHADTDGVDVDHQYEGEE